MYPIITFPDGDEIQNDHSIEKVVREICSDQESHRGKSCDCEPPRHLMTRAGPFVLGVEYYEFQQNSNIHHFIARKFDEPDADNYYFLKIITLPIDWRQETRGQSNSKIQIYNEYSVLSLLKDVPGVIQERGLYLDYIYEQTTDDEDESHPSEEDDQVAECGKCRNLLNDSWKFPYQTVVTMEDIVHPKRKNSSDSNGLDHHFLDCEYLLKYGKFFRRLILALDCHVPHCYLPYRPIISQLQAAKCPRFEFEFENLQEYVKRCKYVPEMKALKIFAGIVDIMYAVHAKNIAHRDLRLENILYNEHEEKIIITNFGLSRYVINDKTCICDHRGSSAYISPDVLKRIPYQPIASDCWTLGVIFYTMLYGRFPFNADNLSDLFRKIQNGEFRSPTSSNSLLWNSRTGSSDGIGRLEVYNIKLSPESIAILQSLIETDVGQRNNIAELRERLDKVIRAKINDEMEQPFNNPYRFPSILLEVPDIDNQSIYLSNPQDKKSNIKSKSKQSSAINEAECNFDHQIPQDYSMNGRGSEFSVNQAIENDHIYARKVPDSIGYDAYKAYYYRFLKSSNWDLKLKFSTYIPSLRRFYTDRPQSIYDFPGRTSLSYERLHKERLQLKRPMSADDSNSNEDNDDSVDELSPTAGSSPPTKMKKNLNMTVLKVDSDIRPLEDYEYGLVEQKLRFSSHNNSNI